jgi:hypothetical protein
MSLAFRSFLTAWSAVLRTLDGTLSPPACTTPLFADVPASSPYCRWIEELARRGVVSAPTVAAIARTTP